MTEDNKFRSKYKDLKRRIRDIEEENDTLHIRIHKARKSINRLRLERTFLLERMGKMQGTSHRSNGHLDSDHSDVGSDILSHDESEMSLHRYRGNGTSNKQRRIEKTPRKKKDPNAPKGPGNVFFLFCRLERDKIKDEFPQENLGDVTKLLGQKWKALTKEGKQKYYDMYRKEVEEWEEAMKSYNAGGNPPSSVQADAAAHAAAEGDLSALSSPLHASLMASPEHPHPDYEHEHEHEHELDAEVEAETEIEHEAEAETVPEVEVETEAGQEDHNDQDALTGGGGLVAPAQIEEHRPSSPPATTSSSLPPPPPPPPSSSST
ncbi:hypothetical protein BCR43DRAFT_488727 [Syncephalastrum racemosum]|uniref:HMG box domain-containing protein n=1 Tax=Syncephalastrum racemosum TaxID=13706 RepID=A0A1X2HJ85_SYNRA|nr:hypothetical protein BCR43DRAFT_488727 [Syncephalastrum racemosum]